LVRYRLGPIHFETGLTYSEVATCCGYAHWDPRGEKMPGKKHLRGVGSKEQRQYEHIKENAEKSGRYGERSAEVAARTVMKQHREKGHSKGK
jgi:hypothetical protein